MSATTAIVRIKPANYPHVHVFDEVIEGLSQGLRDIGHQVSVLENTLAPKMTNIVIGAHLLSDEQLNKLPHHLILYNFEQLHRDSTWARNSYLRALGSCQYWDYSRYNIDEVKRAFPSVQAEYVPLGYSSCLTRLTSTPEDIDVLFYGSVNERRQTIFDKLRDAGVRLHTAFGVYGPARDELIRRAKVILNLHYYDSHIFEVVRVSYLMANKKAVVSEYATDTELYASLHDGLRLARYEELVPACLELVANHDARVTLAERGFRAIQHPTYADILRSVSSLNC